MALQFPTRAERPGKLPHTASLERGIWPEFMYHDAVLERLFDRVISEYAEFQFYAWDDERDEVVGGGNAIPTTWDGAAATLLDDGVDGVVEARFADDAPPANVLCALQILIAPECRGEGLSSRMIRRMAEIGRDHGLDTLIAPVRPNLKHRYPQTPMERYIGWRRPDGTHLDPWLRTHERLGAKIVKVAPQSTRVPGSVGEWEEWGNPLDDESAYRKKKRLHATYYGQPRVSGYRDNDDNAYGYYEHRLDAVRFGSKRWWSIYSSR
jgi:GNAT superfamily N-acetyltransferase